MIISYQPNLRLPSVLFPIKVLKQFIIAPVHITFPNLSHSPWLWQVLQITKLLIMLLSSASSYFFALRAKYFLQHPILKQFILCSSLHTEKQISQSYKAWGIYFFFDKTTERQTLVNETDTNIPRVSSVHSPFANEILSF